jgi:hypothetical protein
MQANERGCGIIDQGGTGKGVSMLFTIASIPFRLGFHVLRRSLASTSPSPLSCTSGRARGVSSDTAETDTYIGWQRRASLWREAIGAVLFRGDAVVLALT